MVVWLTAAGLMAAGFAASLVASRSIRLMLVGRLSDHIVSVLAHLAFYSINIATILVVLPHVGLQLSALLGAAGVVGIAVGFAAQTSISNMISGIFLLMEGIFRVGDTISCDGHVGIIQSIELFSVKLRNREGMLIRIPNEVCLKQASINRSIYGKNQRYIRIFIDMAVGVDNNLKNRIIELVRNLPEIENDPAPALYSIAYRVPAHEYDDGSYHCVRLSYWSAAHVGSSTDVIVQKLTHFFVESNIRVVIRPEDFFVSSSY